MPTPLNLTLSDDNESNWKDSAAETLAGSTVRDSQDLELVTVQPTTALIRDSQDLELITVQPTTALIRDSQDLEIVTVRPTTALIRNSQDIQLVTVSNFFFVLTGQTTDNLNNWADAFSFLLLAIGGQQPRVCVVT